jgi:S-adenosylmethionine:tRNA ribosyltransferase-isomerase
MHDEFYELPASTHTALRARDRRIKLAIGTTSLRAIEDFHRSARSANIPEDQPFSKYADIYIYPPEVFSADALITNFHLPRSSLLCLVSAFLTPGSTDGIAWLKSIYSAALKRNFRFYSYGDAMLIL